MIWPILTGGNDSLHEDKDLHVTYSTKAEIQKARVFVTPWLTQLARMLPFPTSSTRYQVTAVKGV